MGEDWSGAALRVPVVSILQVPGVKILALLKSVAKQNLKCKGSQDLSPGICRI